MAAKIRLSRVGGRSKPYYRVVVIDESCARDGLSIEVLGHYNPRKSPAVFEINKEKTQAWLKKGAIPSEIVRKYLGKIGVLPPVDFSKRKKKLSKNQQEGQPPAETKPEVKA